MHLTNKILLGCIAVFSLVFFVFGLRVLKTQNEYRSRFNQIESTLQAAQKQQEVLLHGDRNTQIDGVEGLALKLDQITAGRGNVWYRSTPGEVNAEGAVNVTVEGSMVPQIAQDKVMYAFGDRETGVGYLTEFRVTAVKDNVVTLTPVSRLISAELERLKNPGPWTLYEVMPADDHQALYDLKDEEFQALLGKLPESVQTEYKKDQTNADPNDPPERVVNGKYDRRLRDYVGEFHEFSRQRSIYLDRVAAALKDTEYLTNSIQNAEQTIVFRAKQIEDTKQQIAELTSEKNIVLAHQHALESQLEEVQISIRNLAKENERLAAQLAQRQSNALGRVNSRTAAIRNPSR